MAEKNEQPAEPQKNKTQRIQKEPLLYVIGGVAAITAIVGVSVGCVWLFRRTVEAFFEIDPEVAAAIIVASGTIIVSVLSVTLTRHVDRKRDLDQQARDKKIPIYEEFMEFWFRMFFWEKRGQPQPTQQEIVESFTRFNRPLIIWGSDDVIRKWRSARSAAAERKEGSADLTPLFLLEDLLMAMRRDAGYPKSNLNQGEILGLFINDIDDHLPSSSTSS